MRLKSCGVLYSSNAQHMWKNLFDFSGVKAEEYAEPSTIRGVEVAHLRQWAHADSGDFRRASFLSLA